MNSKEINAVCDRLRASRPYEVGEHFNEEIEDAWRIYDKGKQEYYDAWSEPDGATFTSESDREAAVWGVWRAVQAERERCAKILEDRADCYAKESRIEGDGFAHSAAALIAAAKVLRGGFNDGPPLPKIRGGE